METTRKSDSRDARSKGVEEISLDVTSSKNTLSGTARRHHSKDSSRSRSSSYSSRSSSGHSSPSPGKHSRSGSESSEEQACRKSKIQKRRSSSSEDSIDNIVLPKKNKTSSVHNVRSFRKRSSSRSQSRSPSGEKSDVELKSLSDLEKRTSHSSEREFENCVDAKNLKKKVPSKEHYVDNSRKNNIGKSHEKSPFSFAQSNSKERSCSIDSSRLEKSASREPSSRCKDKSPPFDQLSKISDHVRLPDKGKFKKSKVPDEKEHQSRSRDKRSHRSYKSRSRSQSRGHRSRSRDCSSRSGVRRSRSRSRDRRSRSRDRRSRSRDRRSRSKGRSYRSRKDDSPRRRRSHSRDRYSYRSRLSPRKRLSKSRERSRSREHRRRSRSGSRDRHRHRYHRRRSSSHSRYRRRHTVSRSRSRSSSRLSSREKPKGDLVSTTASLGSLPLSTTIGAMTPQMALQQTMAQMSAKAQALTGIALPKYYNPAAVNPLKYAEQVQKRKLLWQPKEKPEEPSKSTVWDKLTFSQDDDGKMTAKFRKLMGIKAEAAAREKSAAESDASKTVDESALKKQEELFRNLDQQYEMARMSTHTHRGVGLGYTSQAIFPPLQK